MKKPEQQASGWVSLATRQPEANQFIPNFKMENMNNVTPNQ